MDAQLPFIGYVPGSSKEDRKIFLLRRNIKSALQDTLVKYCEEFEKIANPAAPMHQLVSCHLYVMKQTSFQVTVHELYGQQSALTTSVGSDYQRVTNDQDEGADRHLEMISLVYPYEFVIEMFSNSEFVRLLLKTITEYTVDKHLRAVSIMFNWIKKFRNKSEAAKGNQFLTAQNPMCFSLAEQFVTMFVHQKMTYSDWHPLRNFSTHEKCALIAKQGLTDCGLNEKIVATLRGFDMEKREEEEIYIRPTRSTWTSVESEGEVEKPDIAQLHHVVLELRKMNFQVSPSAMLYVLSTAIQWLKAAIKTAAGHEIGADEIMPFFVYCLSVSKPICLPGMISFIDHFIDDALKETSFLYYIEQLKAGLEFIELRMLPVQPFIVMPYKVPPKYLIDKLRLVSDEPVYMKGFEVWAFPRYSPMRERACSAMIRYTGSHETAKCYQFEMLNGTPLLAGQHIEAIPTLHGTFMQCSSSWISKHGMIRVEDGDFMNSQAQVDTVSAMIQMLGGNIANPSVGVLNKMYDMVRRMWRLSEEQASVGVSRIIAEVQKALIFLDVLPSGFQIDGVLNEETWEAMGRFFNQTEKFVMTPKVFDIIIGAMKRKLA